MAKKARKVHQRKQKRRSLFIFPYVIMALLIVGIPFLIYQFFASNVDRSVEGLETAIKTYDTEYIDKKTDRLPIILEVLRTSYSDDSKKQEEFYDNAFTNLEIEVENQEKKSGGKEVKLEISNVNYIDVYEKIDDSEDDQKIHDDYMAALSDSNQEKNTREATIFLKRKINGYDINESRDFVNAILGGALEYASDFYKDDSPESSTDTMDGAINNN